MSSARSAKALDRYSEIGTISITVRNAVKRLLVPLSIILGAAALYLFYSNSNGALAFTLMSAGTCFGLRLWSSGAIGLPLMPMLLVQNLLIYGIPIAAGHENILTYPAEYVTRSGIEVLTFDLVMALTWSACMRMFRPSPPISYVLHEVNKSGTKGWRRMGFTLILASTAFQVLASLGFLGALYSILPSGADSMVSTLVSVMTACGFFLVSMVIGADAPKMEQLLFWGLLVANSLISASSFLLAGVAAYLISVAAGLFWSNGRVPWRYLTISILALAFFNIGKTTMRERYWVTDEDIGVNIPFMKLPAVYSEWSTASANAVFNNGQKKNTDETDADYKASKNQTLLDRIDNLQNLLFVIDAMENSHVGPLDGKTYWLIPPLLVPRILWPEKPRSHEGQVLLNVHFGRQDLNSTLTTYIAWGLIPEAYGNFGPFAGSIFLGIFLGAFCSWIENWTSRKLLVSAEGFISLSLFMNLMNSFEMVASVLVTSTFQSVVIIIAASVPFVRRMPNPRPKSLEDPPNSI